VHASSKRIHKDPVVQEQMNTHSISSVDIDINSQITASLSEVKDNNVAPAHPFQVNYVQISSKNEYDV
jgi:hypothetical protein